MQPLQVTIDKIGSQGDGIGLWEEKNVIVPLTAGGDVVTCKVKYTAKDRVHASLLEVKTPSPVRQAAPCKYYGSCGGCNLQHINALAYKEYKLGLLASSLENPIPEVEWHSAGEGSRRRATIRYGKGKLGFYAHQSHDLVDISACLVLEKELEALLPPLKDISRKLALDIESWALTLADNGIDIILHSKAGKIKNEGAILERLSTFAISNNIARLAWKHGRDLIPVIVQKQPFIRINNRDITLPPEYFLQASKNGQEAIISAVRKHVLKGSKLLDLYSGIGIYSFALADIAAHSSAYEIAPDMVKSMAGNIAKHQLGGKISANVRDIDESPLGADMLKKYDAVVINPPRTGAYKQSLALAESKVPLVVMVSCNSQTFARDAAALFSGGYKLQHLYAIDQFYYSHHLEQVGVFGL